MPISSGLSLPTPWPLVHSFYSVVASVTTWVVRRSSSLVLLVLLQHRLLVESLQLKELLFASRALQGVFAALLAPAALAIISVTFTVPSERAKAFGVIGAISGGGAAIGLILGGTLTEYASWRWCLGVNTPIAILAAILAIKFVHESKA